MIKKYLIKNDMERSEQQTQPLTSPQYLIHGINKKKTNVFKRVPNTLTKIYLARLLFIKF